jgi:hypothetical protein
LSPGDLAGLLAGLIVALVLLTLIIGAVVYGIHKNRLENALKRDLLDRGMSADEIATVVKAKTESQPLPRSRWR